jgi:hypothetical protein
LLLRMMWDSNDENYDFIPCISVCFRGQYGPNRL